MWKAFVWISTKYGIIVQQMPLQQTAGSNFYCIFLYGAFPFAFSDVPSPFLAYYIVHVCVLCDYVLYFSLTGSAAKN